jgi:regulator of protease activity HflC (stomatin/prohibitin superfamily)
MNRSARAASEEILRGSANGYLMLLLGLIAVAAGASIIRGAPIIGLPLLIIGVLLLAGIYMLQPNQAALLLLFGDYRGTDRSSGLRWANPFYRKTKVSLRAHNLNSEKLKVNDKRGSPIEIACAIVWRVQDTAQASFDVENYQDYVRIQSDAAIRHVASRYAYDDAEDQEGKPEITLRSGMDEVTAALARELQERLDQAGILVEDAKLTHLAYAPEIAGVMLRRQQAEAVIAARQKIVQGAVTMVDMALKGLSEHNIVELDNERKAAMVSNLLVVLCADSEAQPVINTGTLYN